MKFNILALSATVFLFNQVFAAPADSAAVEAKTNAEADMPIADNALEADLMTLHGWDKKDTQMLTTFLESIDRLGSIVNEASLDPASAELMSEFQTNAQQLMAQAGYEYKQLDDNRRVLTRVSSENGVFHEELIPELIQKLVKNLTDMLTKLQETLSKNGVPDFITKIIGSVAKLIKNIGDKISGIFGGGGSSTTSS